MDALLSHLIPAAFFVGGIGILVFCVERLVGNLAKAGIATGISAFFLTVVLVGMDFENWAFGISAQLDHLPGVALGSAVGSALFLVGVAVPAAGLFVPFEVEVPRDYLLLTLAGPFVLLPFLLDGSVGRIEGAVLFAFLAAALAYFYVRERSGRAMLRDHEAEEAARAVEDEARSGAFYLGLSVALLAGVVAGSELAVWGARGLVGGFGLDETAFGMTVVGLVMSLEEVLLVVEPVRKGRTSIAVGNVLGSLLFFATGNVGVIALTRPLPVEPRVLTLYWPFLAATTLVVVGLLWRGRIGRWAGAALGVAYVAYWGLAYAP